ncbi:MAG TPA: hypothetical protein VF941_24350 [Clostridia bacterium]
MSLQDYITLSDSMSNAELKEHFNKLLDYAEKNKSSNQSNVMEIIDALIELADRQWHTYELLDVDTKERIDKWVCDIWSTQSSELVDNISCLIARLGLVNSYNLMKASLNQDLDDDVKAIVIDAIEDLKNKIDDPYLGMRKFESK